MMSLPEAYQAISQALSKLGSTPQEVYQTLLAQNCKGKILNGGGCPLANYLQRVTDLEVIVTDVVYVRHLTDITDSRRVPLPDPVRSFRIAFDNGLHQDLIEP
jgi:hypothetical protein